MEQLKREMAVVLFVGVCLGSLGVTPAAIITSVSRGGSSTNDPPQIAPNPLFENELCFVDRQHQYNDVPGFLLGAEYIMVANNDKAQADYSLEVALSQPAELLLFLDNRLGHGDYYPSGYDMEGVNPYVRASGMGWVYDMGFMDTGTNIGIDEGGDGDIDQWFSVYSKRVSSGTITLYQQNDVTNPGNRNMYGVAALKGQEFPPFWFYDARLPLVKTPDMVTVVSGRFGGWFWWQDESQYWYDPYDRGYRFEIKTDDPPRDFYGHYSNWSGNPYFWAFNDRLTFTYTDSRVRSAHRWFYFWDPANEGHCLELITGEHLYPLDPNISQHLDVQSHKFTVNTKVNGDFSNLVFLSVGELEAYLRNIDGIREWDVQAFIGSEIIQRVTENDPCGEGLVAVQHARWPLPTPVMECSVERLEVSNGDEVDYAFRLSEEPAGQLWVDVTSSDDDGELEGSDPLDGSLHFLIDPCEWGQWQMVRLKANVKLEPPHFPDIFNPNAPLSKTVRIAHYLADDPTKGFVLPVKIKIKIRPGYLASDLNRDRITDFRDLAAMATDWLVSTEPPVEIDLTNHAQFSTIDVGTTCGSASWDGSVWTVQGDGHDIWDTTDSFHYVYKQISIPPSAQLTATVQSLDDTHEWAKAGLMVRKTLDADSAHAMIVVTPKNGVAFQWREGPAQITQSVHAGTAAHLKPPVTLRLVVTDSTVTGYYYTDGRWVPQGSVMGIVDPEPPHRIGMIVSSHVPGELATAKFGRELVSLGPQPEPPD